MQTRLGIEKYYNLVYRKKSYKVCVNFNGLLSVINLSICDVLLNVFGFNISRPQLVPFFLLMISIEVHLPQLGGSKS